MEDKKLPVYEMPKVITYTDEEILEELGTAQAYGGGTIPTTEPPPSGNVS